MLSAKLQTISTHPAFLLTEQPTTDDQMSQAAPGGTGTIRIDVYQTKLEKRGIARETTALQELEVFKNEVPGVSIGSTDTLHTADCLTERAMRSVSLSAQDELLHM